VSEIDAARFLVLLEYLALLLEDRERELSGNRRERNAARVDGRDRRAGGSLLVERLARALEERRLALAGLLELGAQPIQSQRVHDLERPDFPAITPLGRAIDGGEIVRKLRSHREAVVRLFHEEHAQERALLAAEFLGLAHTLGARELEQRLDFRRRVALLLFVLEGLPVEREDVLALLVVEARLGLVAEAARFHEVEDPGGEREVL